MSRSRIIVDVSSRVRRLPISVGRIETLVRATLAAERKRDALISVTFVGEASMSRMNRDYLGRRGATDVIAFAMRREGAGVAVIGDIYICPLTAKRNAAAANTSMREELARLVIHGTLHTVGREHPDDGSRTASAMWRQQERILDRHR